MVSPRSSLEMDDDCGSGYSRGAGLCRQPEARAISATPARIPNARFIIVLRERILIGRFGERNPLLLIAFPDTVRRGG
jgi:hypothetical protein